MAIRVRTILGRLSLGLLTTALIYVLAEVLLWGAGVVPLSRRPDPFLGFSSHARLFEELAGGRVRIAPRHGAFRKVHFEKPKPPGTFRIFVFGGSTVWGWPMGAEEAFPARLEKGLRALYPGRPIEVHNLGAGSFGSWRIRHLAAEAARYEPDLFLLYAGNNEFLEKRFFRTLRERAERLPRVRGLLSHSRVYSVMHDLLVGDAPEPADDPSRAQLDDPIAGDVRPDPEGYGGSDERRAIVAFFGQNLRAFLRTARQAGARAMVCTLPINLLGTGPTRSAPVRDRESFDRALALEKEGRSEAAEVALEHLAEAEPKNALIQLHLGRVRYARGRLVEAREALLRSLELDLYPQRALPEMNALIRGLGGALPCDLERDLSGSAKGGLLGDGFFIDTMHPKLEAHGRIAELIGRRICASGLLGPDRWDAGVFRRAATPPSSKGVEDRLRLAQRYYFIGKKYARAGEHARAVEQFREAIRALPSHGPFHQELGVSLGAIGKEREAITAFEEAVRLAPDDVYARLNLGVGLGRAGRLEEALPHLRRATELRADWHVAWTELGRALAALGRREEALEAVGKALDLDPGDALARELRARVLGGPGGR